MSLDDEIMSQYDIHPIRIGLLLIDGFALLSYASFIEPFRAANSLAGRTLYEWTHISLRDAKAVASNGAELVAGGRVGNAPQLDRLFVFAAGDPATFRDEACFAWLRLLARKGIPIGGVSGGPYLLARAGVLEGFRATIHWDHAEAFRNDFPAIELETGLYAIDRDRMTCAGGTAGLDLAVSLIERDHGDALARKVGEWFIQPESREAHISQRARLADRYGTSNTRLLLMLGAMEGAVEEPLKRDTLASRAGISLRQLERLCLAHLGSSIAEIYLAIRLDRAAELLRSTGLPVTQVAMACGFRSPAHFSRRYRQRFGKPPSR